MAINETESNGTVDGTENPFSYFWSLCPCTKITHSTVEWAHLSSHVSYQLQMNFCNYGLLFITHQRDEMCLGGQPKTSNLLSH